VNRKWTGRALVACALGFGAVAVGCGGGDSAQDAADSWFEKVAAADPEACAQVVEADDNASDWFQELGYIYPDTLPSEGATCEEFLEAAGEGPAGMDSVTVEIPEEGESEAEGTWSYEQDSGVEYAGNVVLTKDGDEWLIDSATRD
jgi:hypothetical protein